MLTVPLSVSRTHYDDGYPSQHLKIWSNGELHIIPSPIRPYLISLRPLRLDYPDMEVEEIIVKPLNDFKERKAWRYSFDYVEAIQDLNYLTKTENKNFQPELLQSLRENHLSFTERVASDVPDFYKQYPENLDSIYCLDLETLTSNFIDQNKIIAIGQSDNKETWCNIGRESQILEDFRNDWKRCDPDIVVGYYQKDFDFPYLIKRMNAHNIPCDFLHRDGTIIKEPQRIHRLTGRLMYDVFENVYDDQVIRLKDDKLKTVAREHFKLPAIEEDLSGGTDYLLKDPDRLVKYCESDVDTTLKIFQGYFAQSIAVANQIIYPIDNLNNPPGAREGLAGSKDDRAKSGMWTMIGRIIAARGFNKLGYIENRTNRDKFPAIAHRKGFQGAFSGTKQTGRFDNILHVDVSSMYPNIQISFNISPDTTKIYDYEPYDPQKPILRERTNDHILFCIPDENIGHNVLIWTDLTHEGVMPKFLTKMKKEREKWKNLYKKAKTEEDKQKYWSLQYSAKVLLNGCGYGINTPASVRYGDLAVGIAITGMGRYLLFKAIDWMENKGFLCTEFDTDGSYHIFEGDYKKILNQLNKYLETITKELGIASKIEMEGELWKGMYVHKTKNYFLWDGDGNISIKGSAFKSRKQPGYIDKFITNMGKLVIKNVSDQEKTNLIKQAMRIDKYSLQDLTLHTKPTKYPKDFKNNNIGKRLMLMAERQLNIPAVPYTTYEYVHGIRGEMLTARANMKEIDYQKYRELLSKKCANFNMEHIAQRYIKTPGFTELKQEIW